MGTLASIPVTLRPLPLQEGARRRPGLVLLGVVPPGWGAGARLAPLSALDTEEGPVRLHLLRVRHPEELRALPGLDLVDAAGRDVPSRLRDAAALALLNTTEGVEIALVEIGGRAPWDIAALSPAAWSLLDPYLEVRPGAVLVWPDAPGPDGSEDDDVRWARLVANVRAVTRLVGERYQIVLADAPPCPPERLAGGAAAVRELFGLDAAVVGWTGPAEAWERHGWRSGAAAVGARLSEGFAGVEGGRDAVVPALIGRRLRLGAGRATTRDRVRWGEDGVPVTPAVPAELVGLSLDEEGARVVQDPSLRQPVGTWPLPALWVVRQFVRRLTEIAQQFVFMPLEPYTAQALRSALSTGIVGFRHVGAAEGVSHPVIARMVRDPSYPRLEATLTVAVRPWIRAIRVEVAVAPERGVTVVVE